VVVRPNLGLNLFSSFLPVADRWEARYARDCKPEVDMSALGILLRLANLAVVGRAQMEDTIVA